MANSAKDRVAVLMVDDQAMFGEAVRRMLASEADIEFHFTTDSAELVGLAEKVKPTVILQDLLMPGIAGLTLIEMLRKDPVTGDIPLVILSSKGEAPIKNQAFVLGASDYVVKFPEPPELIARVRYHSRVSANALENAELGASLEAVAREVEALAGLFVSTGLAKILAQADGGQEVREAIQAAQRLALRRRDRGCPGAIRAL